MALVENIYPVVGAANVTYDNRTADAALRDRRSCKDYGAIGDGTLHPLSERFSTLAAAQAVYPFVTSLTDSLDYAGIQANINDNRDCFIPAGHYYINKTIVMTNSVKVHGETNPNINRNASFLSVTGNFACFNYDARYQSGELERLYIYYGEKPTGTTGNDGKIGVLFNGGDMSPGIIKISHVDVDGAYWGFYDASGNYLCEYENCWVRRSTYGWHKSNGTTINWTNCYCMTVNLSWYVVNCASPQWNNSGADDILVNGDTGSFNNSGFYIQGCRSFVINGWAAEANVVSSPSGNASSYMRISDSVGTISGVYGHGNKLRSNLGAVLSFISCTEGSNVQLLNSVDSFVKANSITYEGTGAYVQSLYADATSKLVVQGGDYKAPTGGTPALSTVASGNVMFIDSTLTGLNSNSSQQKHTPEGLQVDRLYSLRGTTVVNANASTALFELPAKDGTYLIGIYTVGGGTNYATIGTAIVAGSETYYQQLKEGAFLTVQVSGRTVGLLSQGTSTFRWSYTCLG